MPCPECGAEDRLITKAGRPIRKNAVGPGSVAGVRVQKYLCTKCGLCTRGSRFGLPEFGTEETKDVVSNER